MKVIIVPLENKQFDIIHPNHEIFGEGKKDYSELKVLQTTYKGMEYHVMDKDKLPSKSEIESREQWYFEDGEIKTDKEWDKYIMGVGCIKKRYISYLENKIDNLENESNANPFTVAKLMREYVECKERKGLRQEDHIFWYEKALKRLQEEDKKHNIQELLQEKINGLK